MRRRLFCWALYTVILWMTGGTDVYGRVNQDRRIPDLYPELQTKPAPEKRARFREAEWGNLGLIWNVVVASVLFLLLLLIRLREQQKKIRAQNERLAELLLSQQKMIGEKEWLLKEIHHRVKNNLQIVISLLNAQSEFLDNPSAIKAIRESRERMQAIAIMHQKLYQYDESTAVDMDSYIREMVNYLGNSVVYPNRVSFEMDIDKIELDVSQALPLGLILNEGVTNAIQYAFPEVDNGIIQIVLKEIDTVGEDPEILLSIADHGQGFSTSLDVDNHGSLGFRLMQLFSEQLEGQLKFESRRGVTITLRFRKYIADHTIPASLRAG